MRSITRIALLLLMPVMASASGAVPDVHVQVDLANISGLQRGAQTFFNYCASCHSAKYQRYSRVAEDLQLSYDQVEANMVFTGAKVTDHVIVAMDPEDGKRWFGQAPPDLTLVGRSRGPEWLYAYLKSYHNDPGRPFGVNNPLLPGTAMPAVLASLQGEQEIDAEGHLHLVTEGSLSEAEYDRLVTDLVNFLVYIGEPAQMVRGSIGTKVIMFLMLFTFLAYLLKKEYWKDVH